MKRKRHYPIICKEYSGAVSRDNHITQREADALCFMKFSLYRAQIRHSDITTTLWLCARTSSLVSKLDVFHTVVLTYYWFVKLFYYTVFTQHCGAVVCSIALSTKLHVSAL